MKLRKALRPSAVAALAVSAVLLSGCSSTPATASSGTPGAISGQLQIAGPTSSKQPVQAEVDAFEKKYPDVKVTFTTADTSQYQQTTRTQLSSGTAPDVLYVWAGSGGVMSVDALAPKGVLADLSKEPWVATIPAAQSGLTQVEKKTYILPVIYGAIGALYNQGAFDKAGVALPTTWPELLSACDAFNAAGIVPMALGLQTPANGQFIDYSLVATLVYGAHPDFGTQMNDGKTTFPKSGWADAMKQYLELNDHKCFQPNPNGTASTDALTMVSTGAAAMSVQVNSSLPQIQAAAPSEKFGLLALPATDNADDTRLPVALTGTFGISAKAKNPAAAKAFLQFMAENESIYASAVSTLPVDPSQVPTETTPALDTVKKFVDAKKTAPYPDQTWPNAEVQSAHLQAVQDLFSGAATVPQALDSMQAAFDKGKG